MGASKAKSVGDDDPCDIMGAVVGLTSTRGVAQLDEKISSGAPWTGGVDGMVKNVDQSSLPERVVDAVVGRMSGDEDDSEGTNSPSEDELIVVVAWSMGRSGRDKVSG